MPIDTKIFQEFEFEILSQFEDLDNSLDGWLIKSENYQENKYNPAKIQRKSADNLY